MLADVISVVNLIIEVVENFLIKVLEHFSPRYFGMLYSKLHSEISGERYIIVHLYHF